MLRFRSWLIAGMFLSGIPVLGADKSAKKSLSGWKCPPNTRPCENYSMRVRTL